MWPVGQKCEQRQTCSRRPSELCLQRAPPGGTMHIIAIIFIIVENIITIIIIFMNVKKTSPAGPPLNSEFLSLLWFSAIADFWQTFWAIWEMGQTQTIWAKIWFLGSLITSITTIIILIALVTTLMPVSLRLASNQPQNRFCWFHSDSPCLTWNRHILCGCGKGARQKPLWGFGP